jgi:hypothetical protein
VETEVLRFRDFVSQHYAMSKRTDTPYWRYCTEINEYCPEMHGDFVLQQQQYPYLIGQITAWQSYPQEYVGNMFIAAGMGLKSISTPELIFNTNRIDRSSKEEEIGFTKRRFLEYRDFITEYVKKLPSHYQYLKDNIYGGKDDYSL